MFCDAPPHAAPECRKNLEWEKKMVGGDGLEPPTA